MVQTRATSQLAAPRWAALQHTLFILGTLYAVKLTLLQFPETWSYAGPIALLAALAVAHGCLHRDAENWSELGLRRPAHIGQMLGWAVVLLVVTTIVGGILESGVASAFGWEGQEVDPRYRNRFADVPGNTTAYLYWLSVAWIIGGFTEEMLFRGVLISRFERIFGNTRFAMPAAVILQAIVFGQQHFYYQGWAGAVATGATALVSGVFYIALKRNLWPLIISHGLANTLGLTLIYAGLQPAN